jgi:allantoinase
LAGRRLAVCFALSLDSFAFGECLGARLAPGMGGPDVLNFSSRDYGNRVGAWRLLDFLESLLFPASVLLSSSLYEEASELIARGRSAGTKSSAMPAGESR